MILVSLQPPNLPPPQRHGATETLLCNLIPFPLRPILWPYPTLSCSDCWGSLRKADDLSLSMLRPRVSSALQLTWRFVYIFSKGAYRSGLMWNHPTSCGRKLKLPKDPRYGPIRVDKCCQEVDKTWIGTTLGLRRQEEQDLEGSDDGGKLYTNWVRWALAQHGTCANRLWPSRFIELDLLYISLSSIFENRIMIPSSFFYSWQLWSCPVKPLPHSICTHTISTTVGKESFISYNLGRLP